jgi:hypothetical protein
MGAAWLASCGWWLVPIARTTLAYATQSSSGASGDAWWAGLHHYLVLPGMGLIVAGAVAGTVALWRWARPAWRYVWPLAGAVGLSLIVHGLGAAVWSRYLVPLVPMAAVLAGAGMSVTLGRLGQRLSVALPRALSWGLVSAMLGAFVGTNLVGDDNLQGPRAESAGLVSPDPRPYYGFSKAARAWGATARTFSWVKDSNFAAADTADVEVLWSSRGLNLTEATGPLMEQSQPAAVMMVRYHADQPVQETEATWLLKQKNTRRIWTAMDPDGLVFQAYWLGK